MTDIARTSDPQTSHLGAKEVVGSGRRESQKDRILRLLRGGGLTWGEVREATGIEYPWKRLSDLKNDGLIEQRGVRKWMGNDQGVWHLIDRQGELWE